MYNYKNSFNDSFENINLFFRKKLQETIDFVKRSATTMNSLSQTKVIQTQVQKETANVDKKEQEQILYNLPKVGVCTFCNTFTMHLYL